MYSNLFLLKDKVVCLVGGTGLIGAALRDGLYQAKANVIVGTRNIAEYENKERLTYKKMSISDEESVKQYLDEVVGEYGEIDVFINCAFPKHNYEKKDIEDIDILQINTDLQNHLTGYFNCCRYAYIQMKKQGYGSIINFGSTMGEVAPDFRIYENTEIKNVPTYSIIKSGIHNISKYFAVLGAPFNVRVNTIAPGGVFDQHSDRFVKNYSNRVPMARMAKPIEIVGPVIFLATEASSYVTGHTLLVDGGLTAW